MPSTVRRGISRPRLEDECIPARASARSRPAWPCVPSSCCWGTPRWPARPAWRTASPGTRTGSTLRPTWSWTARAISTARVSRAGTSAGARSSACRRRARVGRTRCCTASRGSPTEHSPTVGSPSTRTATCTERPWSAAAGWGRASRTDVVSRTSSSTPVGPGPSTSCTRSRAGRTASGREPG